MFVVGRKVNVLSEVEGREKREELRGEVVRRIIEMNVKVRSFCAKLLTGRQTDRQTTTVRPWRGHNNRPQANM